jgi:CheY-like chemotaxis protein
MKWEMDTTVSSTAGSGGGRRAVVLYEPDSSVRALLSELLVQRGMEVVTCTEAACLVRRLREGAGAQGDGRVVVIGEPAPRCGRYGQLLSLPALFPSETFILLSYGTEQMPEGLEFDAVIGKPFMIEALVAKIESPSQ